MNSRKLPLKATNFGEWLASLGLLQLLNAVSDDPPKLAFDEQGHAHLYSTRTDQELATLLLASTDFSKISVYYYSSSSDQAVDSAPISIGSEVHYESSFTLNSPDSLRAFETSKETKDGCRVDIAIGRGISVRHYVGKALCELASSQNPLRSPIKTWSGTVVFPRIFLNIRERVAKSSASNLDGLLSESSREKQRLRLDHAWEDYFDDGCASLEEGAKMRPAVEWLAFLGLSFFPPEWGWKSLSPKHKTLRSHVWEKPLNTDAVALALHSGQPKPAADFQVVADGKLKKIRLLSKCN
ncbi:MAG: hypothetical protein WAL87_07185 [Chthoniobacterales bacterium]